VERDVTDGPSTLSITTLSITTFRIAIKDMKLSKMEECCSAECLLQCHLCWVSQISLLYWVSQIRLLWSVIMLNVIKLNGIRLKSWHRYSLRWKLNLNEQVTVREGENITVLIMDTCHAFVSPFSLSAEARLEPSTLGRCGEWSTSVLPLLGKYAAPPYREMNTFWHWFQPNSLFDYEEYLK
jgi:hypothetical protein